MCVGGPVLPVVVLSVLHSPCVCGVVYVEWGWGGGGGFRELLCGRGSPKVVVVGAQGLDVAPARRSDGNEWDRLPPVVARFPAG